MSRIKSLCFVLLFLLPVSSMAQVDEEVQVNVMEVWVKVTDKAGHAIQDLRPEEFQVLIDGQRLPLRCFDSTFENPAASAEESGVQSPHILSKGRKFILFFDMLNTMPGDMDYLKARFNDFLDRSFGEEDQAMVFALLPTYHLGLVQKWTSDRFELKHVLSQVHGNMTLRATMQSNERQLLDLLYPVDTTSTTNPGETRGIGQRSFESLPQARQLARNLASQDANRSRYTLNSFVTIASYLSGFPNEERPVLLYFSGGFPMFPGQRYYEIVQKAVDQTFDQGFANITSTERPSVDFQMEVRNAMGLLNRLNVTIYSIDAKGMLSVPRGAERSSEEVTRSVDAMEENHQLQDSLVQIARETGGTAFINSQDYVKGLTQIVEDLNEQYWLCVNLPPTQKHGAYHKIEVKVDRPDVQIRYRKGYVE